MITRQALKYIYTVSLFTGVTKPLEIIVNSIFCFSLYVSMLLVTFA